MKQEPDDTEQPASEVDKEEEELNEVESEAEEEDDEEAEKDEDTEPEAAKDSPASLAGEKVLAGLVPSTPPRPSPPRPPRLSQPSLSIRTPGPTPFQASGGRTPLKPRPTVTMTPRPGSSPVKPVLEKIPPKPRLVIHKMALVNFKSYKGRQVIGPFHKARSYSSNGARSRD
jgi:structural maintenance of chromosome 4